MPIRYEYHADWNRIAKLIIHQALRTRPGEKGRTHIQEFPGECHLRSSKP